MYGQQEATMAKRAHPAHRMSQYGPDVTQADNPAMTQAAKDRSDKWAKDLDADFDYDPKAMFPFATSRHTMTD